MTEDTMKLPGWSRSGGARLATVIAASLLATGAWAQSQPKFPTTLPVPKTSEPAAAPAETPAPAAPAAPAAGPTAAPSGPRDPFEPLVRKIEPGEERKVQEVANLRLVGVIWDVKDAEQIRALVETPDGLGYYLRLNDEKFGGKVVALERDRVRFVVREDIPGVGTRDRTVELRLPKPDGQ
jgi:hypothetical protein